MHRTPGLALLLAGLVGCTTPSADDDDSTIPEEVAETACDLAASAGAPITAAAELLADPPVESSISIDGGPYTVTLQESGHSWVSFAAGGSDNEAVLFLSEADAVEDFWETDHRHGQGDASTNLECPELIAEQYLLELHEGQWYVEIGVLDVSEVWMHLVLQD